MWSVDRQNVLSEILDGEAVIIDLATGRYHAAAGVGATVWAGIVSGDTIDAIMSEVERSYTGVPADAADAVRSFIDSLVATGLCRSSDGAAPAGDRMPAPEGGPWPWAAPVLETHDDLADLMLIDPVHDVTARGWPDLTSDDS